jgi:O-antigen/teichoic acid export membrane protein
VARRVSGEEPLSLAEGEHRPTDSLEVLDSPRAGTTVIRGNVLRLVGYAAGVGLSVVSASLMIRHLGPTDWGGYVTVSSLIGLVAGLSEFGLSNIGVREYATLGHDERIRLIKNLMGLRLALATLGLVAAFVFALAAGYPPVLRAGIALWGIGLMFTFVQQAVGVPLVTRLQFGWVSAIELLRQGATLVVVVALVLLGSGLLAFLAAPIPVSILVLGVTIPLARGMISFVPGFDRAEWSRILRMTIAYSIAATVGTIYVAATVVVMSIVSTSEDTGYYGASYRIFTVLGYVPVLLVGSAFPILSRASRDDRVRLGYALQRLLEVALILGVWLALCTALGADFFIHLIAGPSFEPAAAVLEIQAFALIGTFLAATLSFALLSERLHTGVLVANAVALVAATAAAIALVPFIGAKGAAVATVAGESILAVAYAVGLFRGGRDLRISPRVVPKVVVSAVLAALLVFVPGLNGLALAVAAGAVYIVVLSLLRGVPPELWKALFALRPSSYPPEGG